MIWMLIAIRINGHTCEAGGVAAGERMYEYVKQLPLTMTGIKQ